MIDLFIHIPNKRETKQTPEPMYQTSGTFWVASYTAVEVTELKASNVKGRAKAIPAKNSYESSAKTDIIKHCTVYNPYPANPNMLLIAMIMGK